MTSTINKNWDALADGDHPYHNRGYVGGLPSPTTQIVLYQNDIPRGVAIFHQSITNLDLFMPGISLTAIGIAKVRKYYPNFLKLSILECGPALVSGKSLLLKKDLLAHEETYLTAKAILASFALRQKAKSVLIVFRDFTEDVPIFSCYGFQKIPLLDEAVLEIKWDTFKQYTDALKSHYRSMVKKDIKRLQGIRVEHTKSFGSLTPEIFALWLQTNRRASEYNRDENIDESYFKRLADLEEISANLFFQEDKLVAFNVMLAGESTLYPLWVGVDYSLRDAHSLLFNVYYKTIEVAIAGKKQKVYFGDTTYDLKMRIGCKLVPQYGYVYSTIPFVAKILAKFSKFLIPEQKIKERNVWKV